MNDDARLKTPQSVKAFVFAGKATVTIKSVATGTRFTFKVTKPKEASSAAHGIGHFVKVMTGPCNESSYTYIGFVRNNGVFEVGRQSPLNASAPAVTAFDWFNKQINRGILQPSLEVWHEGQCCRCGRPLTVPESIKSGIGPECMKKAGRQQQGSFASF